MKRPICRSSVISEAVANLRYRLIRLYPVSARYYGQLFFPLPLPDRALRDFWWWLMRSASVTWAYCDDAGRRNRTLCRRNSRVTAIIIERAKLWDYVTEPFSDAFDPHGFESTVRIISPLGLGHLRWDPVCNYRYWLFRKKVWWMTIAVPIQ